MTVHPFESDLSENSCGHMHIGDDARGQELREVGLHENAADLRAVLPVQCLRSFYFELVYLVVLDGREFMQDERVVL